MNQEVPTFILKIGNQMVEVSTSKSRRSCLKLVRFTKKTTDLRENRTFLVVAIFSIGHFQQWSF
jgi:hypothetical protein